MGSDVARTAAGEDAASGRILEGGRSPSRDPLRMAPGLDDADSAGSHGAPTEPVTLEAAIDTALRRNPDLLTIRAQEPVAQAAYEVADTYPYNPQIQSQVLPYTRESDGRGAPVTQQYVLVETFELAGQQGHRSAEAQARLEQVRNTIERANLDVIARTQELFFTALYHRSLLEMLEAIEQLNQRLVGITRRRMKAGLATGADVALAELQDHSTAREKSLAEAAYETALMDLRAYLGLDPDARVALVGSPVQRRWLPLDAILREVAAAGADGAGGQGADAGLRLLVANLPEVLAAQAGVAAAHDGVALADAMRVPNVQIGPMWQRDNASTSYWGVQAQVDIPVVDTGTPLVRQRVAELDLQKTTATQIERKAYLDAVAAYRRYERIRLLVERSRPDFPSSLDDELRRFRDAFKAGQMTLLDVFAARASVLHSLRSMLDLLHELALAASQVTRTTGLTASQLSQRVVSADGRAPGAVDR